jgi:hypothetical protein
MEQPHQEEEQPGQQDGSDQQQEAQQPAGQDDVVLDAFNGSETLAQLQQVLQDPTHFLTPDSELPTTIRQACKVGQRLWDGMPLLLLPPQKEYWCFMTTDVLFACRFCTHMQHVHFCKAPPVQTSWMHSGLYMVVLSR